MIGRVHLTEKFARYRQRSPSDFVEGSFRTQHLGSHGVERIAGRLKSDGWATQAFLIPRKAYEKGERVKVVRGRPVLVK